MKLLSFQSFSIYGSGGGSRILRRLYSGHEAEVLSITVEYLLSNDKGKIQEKRIVAHPTYKKWMRSFLRRFETWLRHSLFYKFTLNKVISQIQKSDYDVLHVVDHGIWSSAVFKINKPTKPIWVSFHDHFLTTGGNRTITEQLWNVSRRRLVISEEMGRIYQKEFGVKPYEIITDGVEIKEISVEKSVDDSKPIVIYFAGLIHYGYIPLFKILADSLKVLASKYKIKFRLRGAQKLDFLDCKGVEIEYLPMTLDTILLKEELDGADILYLPIKFDHPAFYKYSLSTKMIGYLGAAGTILYHGPEDSAACQLLQQNNAAVSCTALDREDMIKAFESVMIVGKEKSVAAKALVRKQFLLENIKQKFWEYESY